MKCEALVPFFAALLAVGLGQMPGGIQDADINEPMAQEALQFAVVKHNEGRNDMYRSQVAEVVSVKRQIVAGVKYYITVKMARTNCRKQSTDENCAFQQDPALAQPYTCTFIVVSQPWLKRIQLVNEKC